MTGNHAGIAGMTGHPPYVPDGTMADRRDERLWFAMTSSDPEFVEESLLRENDRRKNEGRDVFQFFIPYQFLEKRIVGEDAFDDEDPEDPRSAASIRENNSFRAVLKRYVFIRSDEHDLEELLMGERTKDCFRTLWWLRGRDTRRVTVPPAEMEQFINVCCDMRLKFEVCPAWPDLKKNEKVKLNVEGFKGREAWVVDVKRVHDRMELVCGFYIFHETAILKIRHLAPEDVIVRHDKSPSARENNDYKVLEDIQRKLFHVMEHRFLPCEVPEDAVRRRDAVTLEKLDSYRYREFGTLSLKSKHCALMLLCMHLSGDPYGKREFAGKARTLLDEINRKPEDKRPKDVTAHLHFALYMATGDKAHYEQVKNYLATLSKPKGALLQFAVFLDNTP